VECTLILPPYGVARAKRSGDGALAPRACFFGYSLKRCRAPLATSTPYVFEFIKARSLVVVSPGIGGVGYFYCLTLNSPLAFRTHLGMAMARNVNTSNRSGSKRELPKTPTGITGFDEITTGGLPKGRPALICGGAGSGKTLFSVEFLVRGAREFNEPGVFVAFEETAEELTRNDRCARIRSQSTHSPEETVGGITCTLSAAKFRRRANSIWKASSIRLNHAIRHNRGQTGGARHAGGAFFGLAKRADPARGVTAAIPLAQNKGVTAVITAERGQGALTRYGLEEYVADCVVLLDNRVIEQISTRRLRVVKYRGSFHGASMSIRS